MTLFIGMKLDQAKTVFFDRNLDAALSDGKRRALSRAGAFVRRTMKGSIRKAKKSADPGKPPKSKTGLLKKLIFFVYERAKQTVIIGPAKVNNTGFPGEPDDALPILEFGGTTKRRVTPFIETDKGPALFDARSREFRRRGRPVKRSGKKVRFMHTRNLSLKDVDYAPHPFAGPALEKERAKGTLEDVWADSIR